MFERGTINITQRSAGYQDRYVLDADLTYKIRVYASEDEAWVSVEDAFREAIMSDLEIDQDKLALVSDIPIEDLRSIKQRYRTEDLYDSFGRVLFTGRKS